MQDVTDPGDKRGGERRPGEGVDPSIFTGTEELPMWTLRSGCSREEERSDAMCENCDVGNEEDDEDDKGGDKRGHVGGWFLAIAFAEGPLKTPTSGT